MKHIITVQGSKNGFISTDEHGETQVYTSMGKLMKDLRVLILAHHTEVKEKKND